MTTIQKLNLGMGGANLAIALIGLISGNYSVVLLNGAVGALNLYFALN